MEKSDVSLPVVVVVRFVRSVIADDVQRHGRVDGSGGASGAAVLVGHVVDQHVQIDEFLSTVAVLLMMMFGVSDCRDDRSCHRVASTLTVGRRDHGRGRDHGQSGRDRAGTAHVHGRRLWAQRIAEPGHGVLPRLPVFLRKSQNEKNQYERGVMRFG